MRNFIFGLVVILSFVSGSVHANELSGTWKFEKEISYWPKAAKNIKPPTNPLLRIVDMELIAAPNCVTNLKKAEFDYEIFTNLEKGGEKREAIAAYFKRNFGIDLPKPKSYYQDPIERECSPLGPDIFLSDGKLIFFDRVAYFKIYTRAESDQPKKGQLSDVDQYDHKISSLPFGISSYLKNCLSKTKIVKGVPQVSSKCGPGYFPYVATNEAKNPLAKLIGSHNYRPEDKTSNWNNPVSHKLHPVYIVFPPLKEVTLVHVNDVEGEMDVDGYVAIKGGQVTDKLYDGCVMGADFICLNSDGEKVYQLTENGKFKSLK